MNDPVSSSAVDARRRVPAFVAGSEVQRVKSLFESCARSCARLILSILRCGVGLTRADSLLRVCGGGVWRLPSFAGSRGQGRLGLGGLSGQTLTFYLSHTTAHQTLNY